MTQDFGELAGVARFRSNWVWAVRGQDDPAGAPDLLLKYNTHADTLRAAFSRALEMFKDTTFNPGLWTALGVPAGEAPHTFNIGKPELVERQCDGRVILGTKSSFPSGNMALVIIEHADGTPQGFEPDCDIIARVQLAIVTVEWLDTDDMVEDLPYQDVRYRIVRRFFASCLEAALAGE